MIFYYSGCGNSRWIAQQIAASLDENLLFIPDLQREGFEQYDCSDSESIGFVFPIYAWAAPKLVEDFVLSVKWNGKPKYVWFACTCGDEMGMTYQTFAKTLALKGLELDAAFCFQMPETYLCFPGFKLDTEAGAKKKIAIAEQKLPSAIASIKACEKVTDLIVGSLPRIKSFLLKPGFGLIMTDKKYHTLETCTGCGKCAKVCPLHNIKIVDKKPVWQGHCTQCMACYQYCPQNAIQFASYTRGKGQYHF